MLSIHKAKWQQQHFNLDTRVLKLSFVQLFPVIFHHHAYQPSTICQFAREMPTAHVGKRFD